MAFSIRSHTNGGQRARSIHLDIDGRLADGVSEWCEWLGDEITLLCNNIDEIYEPLWLVASIRNFPINLLQVLMLFPVIQRTKQFTYSSSIFARQHNINTNTAGIFRERERERKHNLSGFFLGNIFIFPSHHTPQWLGGHQNKFSI